MNAVEKLDTALAAKIRNFPRDIYENFFLLQIDLLPSYIQEAWVCHDLQGRGLSLKVNPPSNGTPGHTCVEDKIIIHDFPSERWMIMTLHIRFRDIVEVIPDDCGTQYATKVVTIYLNSVAKDLYCALNPGTLNEGLHDRSLQECAFSDLVQPTQAILNALRVICCLGHKILTCVQSLELASLSSFRSSTPNFVIFTMSLLEV